MESTLKKRKLENDLNLNTLSPKRSRRELSLKEKYDLIQARLDSLYSAPLKYTVKKKVLQMITFRWHN